jgi:hypothetical protein
MIPTDLFNVVNVNADSTMRGVTLALPKDRVRDFLPAGLELGEQTLTDKGTHPVTLFFNDMFRVKMSLPNLIPSCTYREHIFGIPFTYLSRASLTPGSPGPYYFMPKLYLDSLSPTLCGLLFWGFNKELGRMHVTADRFTVADFAGHRATSLTWQDAENTGRQRLDRFPLFVHVRAMLSQPNISMLPAGAGPVFVRSDFDRDWDNATIVPVRTAVEVDMSYVPGYECKRYPETGWSRTIDEEVTGSYILYTPWRLSLPYPPALTFR